MTNGSCQKRLCMQVQTRTEGKAQDFVFLFSKIPSVPLRSGSHKCLREKNVPLGDLMDLRPISKPNFHKKPATHNLQIKPHFIFRQT